MRADGQSLHVCCTDCEASLWHSGIFLNSAASIHRSLNIIHSGNLDSVKVQVDKKANSQRAVRAGVKHLLIESGTFSPSLPVTAGSALLRMLLWHKVTERSLDWGLWLWLPSMTDWTTPELHLFLSAMHGLSQILSTGLSRSLFPTLCQGRVLLPTLSSCSPSQREPGFGEISSGN